MVKTTSALIVTQKTSREKAWGLSPMDSTLDVHRDKRIRGSGIDKQIKQSRLKQEGHWKNDEIINRAHVF